jgi:cytoskeletal protein CcmA (bactofilin family)
MRKIFLVTLLLVMLSDMAHAEVINGAASVNEKRLKFLEVNGSATFKDLKIEDYMTVNGSATGKNLQVKKLEVNGSLTAKYLIIGDMIVSGAASLREALIKGSLSINGSLKCEQIKVHDKTSISGDLKVSSGDFQDIEIKSDLAEIKRSKANNIYFSNQKDIEQILELKSGTIVSGNVTFKSGKGKVYLYDGSKVEGKVEGGEVIKK